MMSFVELLAIADKALNYLGEGSRLAGELQDNYAAAKDTLSIDEQQQLDAKLDEVKAKSAEVHTAIQNQV